ncbi:hypothetical protein BGZ76_009023, partial [Entomortierella beljakovae]
VSKEFIETFNSRLLLIYTGKTRLAKNLLQTVLMNWAGQDESVVKTMHKLVHDATECEQSLYEGDMASIGTILSTYFTEKRFLSNTTLNHPSTVGVLLRHLTPYIEGASLAGAGGGGFLVALLKPNLSKETVVNNIKEAMDAETKFQLSNNPSPEQDEEGYDDITTPDDQMWVWNATIDTVGLTIKVGENSN